MRALAARLCRGGVAKGEKGDEGEAAVAIATGDEETGDGDDAAVGGLDA